MAKDFLTHPIPDGLDFAQATLLPLSYPTSYAALIWKARINEGDWVLVHGSTGAVGLAAVEIAKGAVVPRWAIFWFRRDRGFANLLGAGRNLTSGSQFARAL